MELSEATTAIRQFAEERDWAQFHTPRNLVLALTGEVGELAAEFQWLPEGADPRGLGDDRRTAVEQELADVLIYALRLADVLEIEPGHAIESKLRVNAERYPADKARGSASKYTEL